jgi:ADP-ribose pyrophosphatase YjhB (NUDIX family)
VAKKLPFEEFNYIYHRVPRLCVDLIIQSRDGIILSKRDISPSKGKWHLPGGTVLFRESLAEAVKRVAQEETGLEVKIKDILGVLEYSKETAFGHSVAIAFLVQPISGKLQGSKQATNLRYFQSVPKNTIPEQKIFLIKKGLLKS